MTGYKKLQAPNGFLYQVFNDAGSHITDKEPDFGIHLLPKRIRNKTLDKLKKELLERKPA